MSMPITQDCPLCAGLSHCTPDEYNVRNYFRCSTCVDFFITFRAEERLAQAPEQWRKQYSRQAQQAPEGKILLIRMPSPQPEVVGATVAVEAEYVPRSKRPQ